MRLKIRALTAFFMALSVSAFAVDNGPELGGAVSGFLKKNNSPFYVTETIVVPEGKALVVEAGVEIRFGQGTGLDVRGGSMVVMGESGAPVKFCAASESWNGVSITGVKRSEVQGLILSDAEYGFMVESGALEIRDAVLENVGQAAFFVRNGSAEIRWSKIQGSKNIGVWATQSAVVEIEGSTLEGNRIAVVAAEGAEVSFQSSKLMNNEIALVDLGGNHLKQRNTFIQGNRKGIVAKEVPGDDMKRALDKNKSDFDQSLENVVERLGDEPRNPYADGIKLVTVVKGTSVDSTWKISGNAGVGLGYHQVLMHRNHTSMPYISDGDTVLEGEKFKNYFQIPGLFANWNANLVMESPDGRTFEFAADVSNNVWDKFAVHNLQAVYTDRYQRAALGNVNPSAGELYLSGLNLFGASYDLNIFITSPKTPMFQISAFGGEYRASKNVGDKNYDIYMDYIEDGEAESQEIVAGGKIRWNMHTRFNGSLGFVGSKDLLDDPLLRDGVDDYANTASPVLTSRNFFADGNWLFFPGDIKLNGQVAVGAADTSNVERMRSINTVFADEGLNSSNFALLNKLMKNEKEVDRLTPEQLESIFGENNLLTASEKREKLKEVLERANKVAKNYKGSDDKPAPKDFLNYEHWAVSGSYEWSSDKTFIEGFFRYVGREYYSAGSQDLLQNTRMVGGNLKQKITDFWKLGFGYTMNVENSADTNGNYNIFGMGEFSRWGLFSGADSDSLKKHEQDQERTLYVHDAYLRNDFKINDRVELSVKYSVDYRTRSTPQRLYANYSLESGVLNDPWFQKREGKSFIVVADSLELDSARWAKYYDLRSEEYLATQFDERLLKHTGELGISVKVPNNVIRIGGVWVYRSDLSKFVQDDLIKGLDLKDETYGILGYYFNGGNFFEQRYPLSVQTKVNGLRNTFSFTPRHKIYNRNEMREYEWSLVDNFTMPIKEGFLELSLNGMARQNILKYKSEEKSVREMEIDFDGSASVRVHHTPAIRTDWTLGYLLNYRPDNRQDDYRDIYINASFNYDF